MVPPVMWRVLSCVSTMTIPKVVVLCVDVHDHLALPWDAHVPPKRGKPVKKCANKPSHVCQLWCPSGCFRWRRFIAGEAQWERTGPGD